MIAILIRFPAEATILNSKKPITDLRCQSGQMCTSMIFKDGEADLSESEMRKPEIQMQLIAEAAEKSEEQGTLVFAIAKKLGVTPAEASAAIMKSYEENENQIITLETLRIILGPSLRAAQFGATAGQTLDPQSIQKVHYVLGPPKGFNHLAFGHSYLRLLRNPTPSPDDIMLEFIADIKTDKISYLRGLGLKKPYDLVAIKSTYSEVFTKETRNYDRPLKNYELKLSPEQIQILVNAVNEHLSGSKTEKYYFMTVNCASVLARLFQKMGLNISGWKSYIPVSLPKLLKASGLVAKVSVDSPLKTQRKRVVTRFQSVLDEFTKNIRNDERIPNARSPTIDIKEALLSPDLIVRVAAFLKVSEWKFSLPPSHFMNQVDLFVKSYASLEPHLVRLGVAQYLRQQSGYESISFAGSHPIRLNNYIENGSLNISQVELISATPRLRHDSIVIEYKWSAIVQSTKRSAPQIFSSAAPLNFTHIKDGQIFYRQAAIGFIVDQGLSDSEVILNGAHFSAFLQENRHGIFMYPLGFVEKRANPELTKSLQDVLYTKDHGPNPFLNWGLVEAQKTLWETTLFAAEKPRLTPRQNLRLMKHALNGEMTTVPGYKNIYEWTNDIDHNLLIRLIQKFYFDKFSELNRSFDHVKVRKETLKSLQRVLDSGITVPISFTSGGISHSLLVTEIHEDDRFYHLSAYDPRAGIISHGMAKFEKKTMAFSVEKYESVKNPVLNRQDLPMSLERIQLLLDPNRDFLMKYADKNGYFSILPENLLTIW